MNNSILIDLSLNSKIFEMEHVVPGELIRSSLLPERPVNWYWSHMIDKTIDRMDLQEHLQMGVIHIELDKN